MRADHSASIAIRSIGVSVICPGIRARVLRREHGFEASKAANQYRDTAFDYAPQGKPGDLRVDPLSVGDDDTGDSNTDDLFKVQVSYTVVFRHVFPTILLTRDSSSI
jgi:hypothetical protein